MLSKTLRFINSIMKQVLPTEEELYERLMKRIDEERPKEITIDEVNLILKHKYQLNPIKDNFFKIREEYTNSLLFSPEGFNLFEDDHGNIEIEMILEEVTFGSGVKLTLPLGSYEEFLDTVKLTMHEGAR